MKHSSSAPRSKHPKPEINHSASTTSGGGCTVVGFALVSTVFVVVLIIVLTSLGDSIGQGLQGLVDQLPVGV